MCVQSLPREGNKYPKGNRKAQKTPFRLSLKNKIVFNFFSVPPQNTWEIPYFAPQCPAVKTHGINEMQTVLEKCTGNPEPPAMEAQALNLPIPESVFSIVIFNGSLMLVEKGVLSLNFKC